jgi:hypothetical protein
MPIGAPSSLQPANVSTRQAKFKDTEGSKSQYGMGGSRAKLVLVLGRIDQGKRIKNTQAIG